MMQQFGTIRGFSFTFLLLVLFTVQGSWGQNPVPAQGSSQQGSSQQDSSKQDSTKQESTKTVEAAAAGVPNAKVTGERPPSVPLIGAGDLLKVSVLGAPDSDQEVRVGADGNIFLNFIGAVKVAGFTTEQAQNTISKKLVDGGFFTQPQVSVFAKEYATQGVSVLGEVQKPGVYPLLGSRTLFDVLSMAGGTTLKAGRIVSITHRENPQAPINVSLSNDPAEAARGNVDIYPGDTVLVAKAGIVYIVGDVHKPSGVPMENGSITVLQAIAMAEGANPTANLNKSKIIRKTPSGNQEIPLALRDMLTSKTPDVHLEAEDIIFVPNSAAKSATRRSVEAIIQAATGVAMYGVRP